PFTLAIVFAALGACARRRFVWTLVLAALAAVNRTELWPWFAAFGLALCWSQSTGWSRRRRWQLALGVVGTTACAGLAPGVADKAWMTFRQHYAAAAVREDLLGEATTTPARTVDVEWAAFRAFHEPDARVAIDFPAAKSVPEALVENPERFLAHVWRNVRAIPASLVSAQVTTLFPRAFAVGLIAALVAAAACGSWLRRGAGSTWPLPVWLLLVASPLAIAPSTIAAARGELLWPLFPAWAVPIAGGISKLLANRPLRFLRTVAPLALLATAFAVPGPFAKPPSPLQHRDVLELLTMHPPLPGARMVCAWPGYPELIDRRDVMAFSSAYLPFTLDPGIGMQGDLVVSTPDLARQEPKLAEIAAEIVRSGHWRLVGSVGVATLYARVPRGR
ncbi:MAG TPA: hypothetical protein VFT55_16950, partial [Planctomycetota bacterium]|nr:hypothetical protein [Planctomycetota bacterium]